MNIPERLKSRKLWVAIVTAVVIVFGLPEELIMPIVLIAMTYIGGQAVVDYKKS